MKIMCSILLKEIFHIFFGAPAYFSPTSPRFLPIWFPRKKYDMSSRCSRGGEGGVGTGRVQACQGLRNWRQRPDLNRNRFRLKKTWATHKMGWGFRDNKKKQPEKGANKQGPTQNQQQNGIRRGGWKDTKK